MDTISKMPANARVWVFQNNRLLTEEELKTIHPKIEKFISQWAAHGAALRAGFDILYNLFIVISADEQQAQVSGCSLDELFAFIKTLEQQHGLQLLDRLQIAYRSNERIEILSLSEFEQLAKKGEVTPATIVFNNMVTTRTELDTNWEIPLKQSWQSRVLQG